VSNYELLTCTDNVKWHKYLSMLPIEQQDIYFTPEYYKLYEENGDGKAYCFVFKQDQELALYPFLLNKINDLGYDLEKGYFDIQGAYGFNGICSSTNSDSFCNAYSNEWILFCKQNAVVCEFMRINPFMDLFPSINALYSMKRANTTYATNLLSESIMYDEYEHSTRKNINKAVKNDLFVKKYEDAEDKLAMLGLFMQIYRTTMERNLAEEFYYFSDEYFSSLLGDPKINSKLYVCFKEDIPVSTEIVLYRGSNAYSFLGGTLSEYFSLRPNDLLKHNIIQDMQHKGMHRYILGGGLREGDGISRYKKTFAKNSEKPFFIGTKVHLPDVYAEIQQQWQGKFPAAASKYKGKLQGYRHLS